MKYIVVYISYIVDSIHASGIEFTASMGLQICAPMVLPGCAFLHLFTTITTSMGLQICAPMVMSGF